jgi:hypothetical protein
MKTSFIKLMRGSPNEGIGVGRACSKNESGERWVHNVVGEPRGTEVLGKSDFRDASDTETDL